MGLEINKRGNLVRPIPRMLHDFASCAVSAALTYGLGLLNGVDMFEVLPSPAFVATSVLLCDDIAQRIAFRIIKRVMVICFRRVAK